MMGQITQALFEHMITLLEARKEAIKLYYFRPVRILLVV